MIGWLRTLMRQNTECLGYNRQGFKRLCSLARQPDTG